MEKRYTAEGFEVREGEPVWVARLEELPGHVLKRDRPADEDPKATESIYIPGTKVWRPHHIPIDDDTPAPFWRRYHECHTYCESLNRQPDGHHAHA